ncbi:MAG: CocE/NonD family hydrolase, partial [Bacteroidota bacterium]
FETGSNRWRTYDSWPPANRTVTRLYMRGNEKLSFESSLSKNGFDEYLSDPDRPVPYIEQTSNVRGREYMTDDQRFAWRRPDVLSYEMDIVDQDMTIAGPLTAKLFIATSGTDADFIVKVIDVFPDSTTDDPANNAMVRMGGYQMLVRGEVMRGRFRNSYERPEPFRPNTVEEVSFHLQDINHTFKKGHKIMVQVQSSWFPLVDRNPQKFVNIYKAKESDFTKATIRLYHSSKYVSHIEAGIMPNGR